jgi:hypothetical protein
MATVEPIDLPGTLRPLVFAMASGIAVPILMSDGPSGPMGVVLLVAVLAGVVFSTRYSIRAWRRLISHEFRLAHAARWVTLTIALMINGFVCFLVAGMTILVLGVLLTGQGVA